jgi:hypothetical protein
LDAIWLACGGVGASGNNIAGSRWKLKFLVASANRSGMPPLFWKLGPWKLWKPGKSISPLSVNTGNLIVKNLIVKNLIVKSLVNKMLVSF